MDNLEIANYSDALKPLLSLGDPSDSIREWPDYLARWTTDSFYRQQHFEA